MLEDKAKDLGRSIGQSAEYQAVNASSEPSNLALNLSLTRPQI